MKFARVGTRGQERPIAEVDGTWHDIRALVGDLDPQAWAGTLPTREQVAAAPPVDVQGQRFGSPIAQPPAIIGIGQNYAAHAAESGSQPPTEPIVFLKLPSCVAGPDDDVEFPRELTTVDWEVELCVVLGRSAFRLGSEDEALDCVAGYLLGNDLSERTLQRSAGQWSKGKCLPGFAPLGPWVVTPDDIDVSDLTLKSWVNDEPRQHSSTSDMIFGIGRLIHDLSHCMLLEPGMVIMTGTPQGVAMSGRFPYLKDGDRIAVEIDGLGRQSSTMKAI